MKVYKSSVHNELDAPNKEKPDLIRDFLKKTVLVPCVYRPEVDIKCLLQSLSTLVFSQGFLLNLKLVGHFTVSLKESPVSPPGLGLHLLLYRLFV